VNGALFYRGPSRYDGSPILGIVTGLRRQSKNGKTGDMLQTWILPANESPGDRGRYAYGVTPSVCGSCRLGHLCYINWSTAPVGVWKRYRRERVTDPRGLAQGRAVRLGAAGDPAMIPKRVWTALIHGARMWTGYTHQAGSIDCRSLRGLLMRSTETVAQTVRAWVQGFRTFRMRGNGAPLLPGEIDCPAVTHGTQCADCGLCNGTFPGDTRPSISTPAHGSPIHDAARERYLAR
jgi:hypothetical protein